MDTRKVSVLLQRTAELEKELAAKNRELEIEAALERLRVRAMAMQRSEELAAVVKLMYTELRKLDESLKRCMIMIFDGQTDGVTWWIAGDDEAVADRGYRIPYSNYCPQLALLEGWKQRQERWQFTIEGDEKRHWDEFLFSQTELSGLPPIIIQNMTSFDTIFLSASFAAFGGLTSGSVEPLNTASFDILVRFSKVFDLIYTRFNDLQQAEAQAREAEIQLALERVRARTMAMQKSDELTEVATVLFQQVSDLGIKAWTTGFNVWSDDNNFYTDYITSPQGGFIEPYTIDATRFPAFSEISDARKRGEEFYVSYLDGEILKQTYLELAKFGDKKQYEKMLEGGFQFPDRQFNHFVFGAKVSLMFITYEPIPEAHEIFKRFGAVFEQAYIRFLDLQKAEAQAIQAEQDLIEIKAARKKAEDTLIELRATQQQLIQSEKMASLGELTAGIAHEIQNPLNFVNNFSETNKELLDEAELEFKAGNEAEGFLILADIRENETRVNLHGKRADAIVKSMLEHSRSTKGEKQLTNINTLADEYLRLSYHGFRAKDKTFDAKVETHFDESVGKINIVPQEMGRVLLNLFNNAFYAVNEKKGRLNGTFEPTVQVTTARQNGSIVLKVSDNGNGIPQIIIDKIFQPFFTTKPTGQGTGLGLSLSYDIVKAHNAELKVASKEGEGAEFVIVLPL